MLASGVQLEFHHFDGLLVGFDGAGMHHIKQSIGAHGGLSSIGQGCEVCTKSFKLGYTPADIVENDLK